MNGTVLVTGVDCAITTDGAQVFVSFHGPVRQPAVSKQMFADGIVGNVVIPLEAAQNIHRALGETLSKLRRK